MSAGARISLGASAALLLLLLTFATPKCYQVYSTGSGARLLSKRVELSAAWRQPMTPGYAAVCVGLSPSMLCAEVACSVGFGILVYSILGKR